MLNTQNSVLIRFNTCHLKLTIGRKFEIYQFFLEEPTKPKQGYFYPPEAPGIGITIDEEKVQTEKKLTFS